MIITVICMPFTMALREVVLDVVEFTSLVTSTMLPTATCRSRSEERKVVSFELPYNALEKRRSIQETDLRGLDFGESGDCGLEFGLVCDEVAPRDAPHVNLELQNVI